MFAWTMNRRISSLDAFFDILPATPQGPASRHRFIGITNATKIIANRSLIRAVFFLFFLLFLSGGLPQMKGLRVSRGKHATNSVAKRRPWTTKVLKQRQTEPENRVGTIARWQYGLSGDIQKSILRMTTVGSIKREYASIKKIACNPPQQL